MHTYKIHKDGKVLCAGCGCPRFIIGPVAYTIKNKNSFIKICLVCERCRKTK